MPYNRIQHIFARQRGALHCSFLSLRRFPWRFILLLIVVVTAGSSADAQKNGRKRQRDLVIPVAPEKGFHPREEALVVDGMKYMIRGEADRALPVFEELIQLAPQSAAAHYLLATAQVKLSKPEGVESAKKAYQLDNKNVYFGKFLAENLARQKKFREAAEIYEQILKQEPANLESSFELAAAYVFSDQVDKAIDTYNRLEKNIGVTEEITKQKQQLYLRQNKLDKALEEAQKLIDSEPAEAYYHVALGELYMTADMLDKAVSALQEALRINPDEAQAHILLADIYRRNGETDKCNKELQIVFGNPSFDVTPKIHVMAGYIEMLKANEGRQGVMKSEDRTEAMKLARLLIDTHPAESRPYALYGDLLVYANEKAKARDSYARAARIDGSAYEIWGALLQLDGELNQFDSLLTHSEMALEVFPNQGSLWYSNGSANLVKKNYAEAASALEESRRLISDPVLSRYIHAQLGDAYNGTGEYGKSDEAYEHVLKEDPENDYVLNNYSYYLSLRNEKLDKAREMSLKLVTKHPDNATYLDTHAWVLYMLKDYRGAKEYLEKALGNPRNLSATIIEHYGDVLSKLGEKDRALEQWRKAKSMGDHSLDIDRKIASGTVHD